MPGEYEYIKFMYIFIDNPKLKNCDFEYMTLLSNIRLATFHFH